MGLFLQVLGHIPPFIEYWDKTTWAAGESSWDDYMQGRIVPLMEAAQTKTPGLVRLVVGGHSHIYQRGKRNGIEYVIIGGGGASLEKPNGALSLCREHHFFRVQTMFNHTTPSVILSADSARGGQGEWPTTPCMPRRCLSITTAGCGGGKMWCVQRSLCAGGQNFCPRG